MTEPRTLAHVLERCAPAYSQIFRGGDFVFIPTIEGPYLLGEITPVAGENGQIPEFSTPSEAEKYAEQALACGLEKARRATA